MDKKLQRLLTKEAPTEQDVAEAKALANGAYKSRIWAMEERRRDAHPTPQEEIENSEGEKELAALVRAPSPD
jgi:hypothetical protein